MRIEGPPTAHPEEEGSLPARVGERALSICHDVGGQFLVSMRAVARLLRLRVDAAEVLRHTDRFAVASLPLVLVGAIIIGGVVAMQGLGYIARYNATDVYGWASGVSAFREVGPMLLGLTLASRLGAKNTAELASMMARERIDALTALGLDEERVVIAPRFFAIVLSAALLYPVATTTVLLASYVLAWAIGDQLLAASWSSLIEYMPWTVVLEGFLRLIAFGAVIAVSSCWFGTRGGRDARAIGRAVYAQSVASLTGVVVLNLYLTFLGGA